jgi:hypothetical protein
MQDVKRNRTASEKNAFFLAMQPGWDEVVALLGADRPPDWSGFHFEAEVIFEPANPGFTISCQFRDSTSNRNRGGAPRKAVDRLAKLQAAYLDFSPEATWKKVRITQTWQPDSRSWSHEIHWAY